MKTIAKNGCIALTAATLVMAGAAFAAPPVAKVTNAKAVPAKKNPSSPVFFRAASNEMAPVIRVNVNGELVQFTSGEPVETEGRILVPLRGVFEKLGASVAYDTDSHTIRAVRGETIIALRPGEETAEINGEVRPLSSPAQIVNGSAVVPLRFISEALGAQVKWDAENFEVAVSTEAMTALALPVVPGDDAVTGAVTGLYPEANLITVRLAGGENIRIPLVSDVNATRKTLGTGLMINATTTNAPAFSAGAIRLGEQITVQRNDKGEGLLVQINTDLRRGEMKSIEPLPTSGGHQITLTDGTVITLVPNALITFGNRPVPLSSLKPAEKVAIRLNEAGEGISLAVITPPAPNVVPPYPPGMIPVPETSTKELPPVAPPEGTPTSTPIPPTSTPVSPVPPAGKPTPPSAPVPPPGAPVPPTRTPVPPVTTP